MDQPPNSSVAAGIGHNQPPEAMDPVKALMAVLTERYADLVARFHELELACARVPAVIDSDREAGVATDFIAQCRSHIRAAEAAHRREKEPFLITGRAVDGFFRRRCDRLTTALAPVLARLGAYRERVAAAERQRHLERQRAARKAAERAATDAAHHRAEAERLAREAQSSDEHREAAEHLAQAEVAAETAEAARQVAEAKLAPTRIHGDYGSSAYASRSWTFEVIDLDRVPREYMSLDSEVVREAITRHGVRTIPGLRIFQTETLRVRGAA